MREFCEITKRICAKFSVWQCYQKSVFQAAFLLNASVVHDFARTGTPHRYISRNHQQDAAAAESRNWRSIAAQTALCALRGGRAHANGTADARATPMAEMARSLCYH